MVRLLNLFAFLTQKKKRKDRMQSKINQKCKLRHGKSEKLVAYVSIKEQLKINFSWYVKLT